MDHWDFWGWIAYSCLGITAIGLAIMRFLKDYLVMFEKLPTFLKSGKWAYVPAALFIIATITLIARPMVSKFPSIVELEHVANQTFRNTTVVLDGKYYDNCVFENVTIRWDGGGYMVVGVQVNGAILQTANKTVINTVDLLKALNLLKPEFSSAWKKHQEAR
ncbi:MAG: hypothetical protein WBV23_10925 [Desulfobaccales bacterium]